jgi:peptide-methionine (R)-S-oxide reductase
MSRKTFDSMAGFEKWTKKRLQKR